MKYRIITGIIGASMIMAALSGCESADHTKETELQTLEIVDMEILDESGTEIESDSEMVTEPETVAMEIDLADKSVSSSAGTDNSIVTETEQDTETETEAETVQTRVSQAQKPGEAEDAEQTEKSSEAKTKKQTEKAAESEGQKQTGKTAVSGTQRQTEKAAESEPQESAEPGAETETRKETEKAAESESELAESKTEDQKGTAAESEQADAETETEEQTGTAVESEQADTETETEESTEAKAEISIMVINDRVNVRTEPSTDSDIAALLTCGMQVVNVDSDGEWSKIRYETETGFADGYVKSEFLSPLDAVYIAKEKVNIREEASTESNKIGELQTGDRVILEKELDNGWSQVRFMIGDEVKTVYVKTEFLEQTDAEDESFAVELKRIMAEAETEPESAAEVESETETESESEIGNAVDTEAEAVTETETKAAAEEESETEAVTESETETETEAITESETEAETGVATEPEAAATEAEAETETGAATETEAVTETETEAAINTGAEAVTEAGTEAGAVATESETENGTEAETESETEAVTLSEGAKGQFELVKMLFPEVQSVGIIYSADNKASEKQLSSYNELASEFGMSVTASEIEEAIDIDLAASELVGSVDCIFCIDDATVTPLVQTIRAYADEVEIPVIGINESHVEQGCVAAYLEGSLHLNQEEAGKFGLDVSGMNFGEITEY
ncbi:MAG: ABC transporter substrate binding protein [Lachnospiraceae bacterium]|nr:ABC transporter substrate binding protein [Lachnospiraceae bacterium]